MDLDRFFRKYSERGRIQRASDMPSSAIRYLNVDRDVVKALIVGSTGNEYIVYIKDGKVYHECPDQRGLMCKHIIKVLQSIDTKIAEEIADKIAAKHRTPFYPDIPTPAMYLEIYESHVRELCKQNKFAEASYFLEEILHLLKDLNILKLFPPAYRIKIGLKLFNKERISKKTLKKLADGAVEQLFAKIMSDSRESFEAAEVLAELSIIFPEFSIDIPRTLAGAYYAALTGKRIPFTDIKNKLVSEIKNALRYHQTLQDIQHLVKFAEFLDIPVDSHIKKFNEELATIEFEGWKLKNAYLLYIVEHFKLSIPYIAEGGYRKSRFLKKLKFYAPTGTLNEKDKFVLIRCGMRYYGGSYRCDIDTFIDHYPTFSKLFEEMDVSYYVLEDAEDVWAEEKISPVPFPPEPQYYRRVIPRGVIIEWDIGDPIAGNVASAFIGGKKLIPDPQSPLTASIAPFDITICSPAFKTINNNLMTVTPLSRINTEQAIELIYDGMEVMYSPGLLELLHCAVNKKIPAERMVSEFAKRSEYSFLHSTSKLLPILQTLVHNYEREQKALSLEKIRKLLDHDRYREALSYWKELYPFIKPDKETLKNLCRSSVDDTEQAIIDYISQHPERFLEPVKVLKNTRFAVLIPVIVKHRVAELENVYFKKTKSGTYRSNLSKTYYGRLILRHLYGRANVQITEDRMKVLNQYVEMILKKSKELLSGE